MTGATSTGTSSARLRVVRKLGRGGMADVYLCRLTGVGGFDKPVVAKVVRPEHAEDAEFARMFMEEARLSARLQHPHLIHVYGIEQTGGRLVLMMEYVDGPSLKALMRAAWRADDADWRHVAALMSDVARGLAHAHGLAAEDGTPLRLVHRDVSLDNILVSREGIPKLIDFGIARAADRGRHTQVGTVKGKLQYMAPEQLDGQDVDHRADIYALGVCLYKALSARDPFPGKTTREIWRQRLAGDFIPLSTHRPDLPAPLLEAVAWAMEPDLEARCGSAEELADVLESVALSADPPSTRAARRGWVRRHAPLPEGEADEDPSEGGVSLSLMLRGSYGGLLASGEPSDPTPGASDGGRGAAGETPMPEPTVALGGGLPGAGTVSSAPRSPSALVLGLIIGGGVAALLGVATLATRLDGEPTGLPGAVETDGGSRHPPPGASPTRDAGVVGDDLASEQGRPAGEGGAMVVTPPDGTSSPLEPPSASVAGPAPGRGGPHGEDGPAAEVSNGDSTARAEVGAPVPAGSGNSLAGRPSEERPAGAAPAAGSAARSSSADGGAAEPVASGAREGAASPPDAAVGDATAVAAPSAPAAMSGNDAPPVDPAPERADGAGAQDDPAAGASAAGQTSAAEHVTAASDALPATVVIRSATELSTAFEAIARAAVADGADPGLVQRAIRAGRDQQLRDFVPGASMTLRPRTIALFLVEVSRNGASPSSAATELRKGLRDGRFGGVK